MAKKRNRITMEMSQTIAESSPLIKRVKPSKVEEISDNSVQEIDLSKLIENPYQPRIDINVHSLNELISSIEQNGLLQPIVVTRNEDGNYTIVAGHRRSEAYKIMGKKTIKCSILKNIKDRDLAILSLTENLMRENLHPIENAIAMKNILDSNIVESQNKLAEYVGLSKGYISKLMNILKLPASLISLIKNDNYTDINILVLLNKLPLETTILKAYHEIKNLTRQEAEKFLKINYLTEKKKTVKSVEITNSNTKVNINIDVKSLSTEQIKCINDKVLILQEELNSLYKNWMS